MNEKGNERGSTSGKFFQESKFQRENMDLGNSLVITSNEF